MISLVNHMNILVIEDEQLLSGSLRELLAQHGFAAEAAYDGPLGLELALTGVYDLIILDVMLPGMDGYEIARRLRSKRVGTPILMLTARSGLDDRVEGLDAGADYYLAKPFETRELLACINAILRRQGAQLEELRYGDAALDLASAELVRAERRVRAFSPEAKISAQGGIDFRRANLIRGAPAGPVPWGAAATSTSPGTWPRASPWNKNFRPDQWPGRFFA